MPLATYRLAQMGGAPPNRSALAFAGITFSSSGLINILLYSWTRNILHISFFKPSAHRFTSAARAKTSHLSGQVSVDVQTAVRQEFWTDEEEKRAQKGSFELDPLPPRARDSRLPRFKVTMPGVAEAMTKSDSASTH
jgi:hypothetical protein